MSMRVGIDRDAEAFAAEHEPDDAQLPILETVHASMWPVVKIQKRAGGNQGFTATVAGREEERNVRDLLGQDVDGAVNPDDLLVSIRQRGTSGIEILTTKPLFRGERTFERGSVGAGDGYVNTKQFHGLMD